MPLTQRMKPDLSAAVPKRFVTLEEAKARGLSWYFTGSDVCRYGHNSARRTANPNICACCERVKAGEEQPIYGKSRTQRYYEKPRRPAGAPVVIQAPAAAPVQVEPTRKEQEFLAALDETRDFDAAAERTNFSRSQIEARASVNDVFRKALTDLCERRGIAWTRAPDAEIFNWSPEIERQFVRNYVDCGMLAQARSELGISASDFHARIAASPTFASLVEDAHPLAALTLKDRATQAAAVGKIDLLKYLEANAPKDDFANLSLEQMHAEITRLVRHFADQGLIDTRMRHRVTGEIIHLKDYDDLGHDLAQANADLVSS